MTVGQKVELARSAIYQALYQLEAVHDIVDGDLYVSRETVRDVEAIVVLTSVIARSIEGVRNAIN